MKTKERLARTIIGLAKQILEAQGHVVETEHSQGGGILTTQVLQIGDKSLAVTTQGKLEVLDLDTHDHQSFGPKKLSKALELLATGKIHD